MAKKCVLKIFCAGAENEEWNSLVTCSANLVPNTTINLYALITIFLNKSANAAEKQNKLHTTDYRTRKIHVF